MRLKGNVSSFSFYLFMAVVQISAFFGFFAHLPQGVTAYGIILALPFDVSLPQLSKSLKAKYIITADITKAKGRAKIIP